ncbi:MFS transporter [Pseudonocardia sp. TRM90224]|uniref:MFS transporter n=1 Tax=Pseudonocardia sp. TRM90224 TaxID=2812678 RepID=UPI001E414F07|nr:MFS transporter [Pseudonocardia sp. TRM90224]
MTTEATPEQAVAKPSGELSHRQVLTILAGLALGMFLAALDQTVVSTAIRTIADDLGGLSLQAWATTAFLITGTISTPLYGKLSDIYGRKPLFLTAITIFVIGSVLCTFAQSMYELAIFRAVQGLGAGGLFSLALTILGDIVPPRQRARYQGYILAVFGTSSVLGPVIGGLFSGQATIAGIDGWRWIFLVNVPLGVIALAVVARVLNVPHMPRKHRIDWPGALTLAVFLVPLLIVAEQGREWGWSSANALICYAVGAVGLVLFLLAERAYGDDALLPLRLFRTRVFALTSLAGVIIGAGMFGGMALLPQFLQIVHGATPTEAGFLMLPLVAGIMLASIISGQITSRTGRYKIFPVIGTALMVGAMLLMHFRITVDIPLWELDLYMAMFGLGLGQCMQTLVLAVQNAVPARDMGVATASSTFFRQLGGTLGTAVFLSIVFSTVTGNIGDEFRTAAASPQFQAALADPAVRADPANRPVLAALSGGGDGAASSVLTDSSFLQRIDERLARPFLAGFTDSMTLTFLIVACVLALAFFVVLFVKELPLRTMSGAQAAAAEEAALAEAAVAGSTLSAEAADAELASAHVNDGRHAMVPVAPAVPAVPIVTGVMFERAILGIALRADGRPLAQVVVTVADTAGHQQARVSTGPDGRYVAPVPASGIYLLVATAEAYQPHAAMVSVTEGGARHDLVLAGTSGVHGTVHPTGGALATVALIDVHGDVAAAGTSDHHGWFRLFGVPAGSYTLTAACPGQHPVAVRITLAAGEDAERNVELPGRSRLSGLITAATSGEAVEEAVATLVDRNGAVVASAVTGADGAFTFHDLASGTYTLVASGYAPVKQLVEVTAGAQATAVIELRPAEPQTPQTPKSSVPVSTPS